MQRSGLALIGLAMVAMLLLSACSGGAAASTTPNASGPDGAQQVTLTVGNSMSFDPANITVRAGQPVELSLRNTGVMPHDFSLSDGVAQTVKIAAGGGQTSSGTFTIDNAGTYTFECSMPGHAAAGMR